MRRDDHLRAGAPRRGRVIRAAHGSRGHDDVLFRVTIGERRDEIDRLGRRHRDLEKFDSVARVSIRDRGGRFDRILAHNTDDLLGAETRH